MAVVRFETPRLWRCCCDAAGMERAWDESCRRVVSRRIQQLQAMHSLAELEVMPFPAKKLSSGQTAVMVTDERFFLIEEFHESVDGKQMVIFLIRGIVHSKEVEEAA